MESVVERNERRKNSLTLFSSLSFFLIPSPPFLSLHSFSQIALVRVGEFYECIGADAVLLVEHAALNPMGTGPNTMPRAGCPVANLRRTLDDLVRGAALSVVVAEEVPEAYSYGSRARKKENPKRLFPIVPMKTHHSSSSSLEPLLRMRFKSSSLKSGIQTSSGVRAGPPLRGWMKFVEVNPQGPKQMSFFVNNNFFDQEKGELPPDDFGPMSIPDSFHFFFVVTNEYMMILSARSQQISRAVQSLPIRKLLPQREEMKGGVEDVGDFKEGFCFKLSFLIDGKKEFIVCADDAEVKTKWMT